MPRRPGPRGRGWRTSWRGGIRDAFKAMQVRIGRKEADGIAQLMRLRRFCESRRAGGPRSGTDADRVAWHSVQDGGSHRSGWGSPWVAMLEPELPRVRAYRRRRPSGAHRKEHSTKAKHRDEAVPSKEGPVMGAGPKGAELFSCGHGTALSIRRSASSNSPLGNRPGLEEIAKP